VSLPDNQSLEGMFEVTLESEASPDTEERLALIFDLLFDFCYKLGEGYSSGEKRG